MDFKTHYFALSQEGRDALAKSVETSVQMLAQVAYGYKKIELGFADVLVAKGGGNFGLNDLPLTDRAKSQDKLRTEGAKDSTPAEALREGTIRRETDATAIAGRRKNLPSPAVDADAGA